jgi:hypothetical protein
MVTKKYTVDLSEEERAELESFVVSRQTNDLVDRIDSCIDAASAASIRHGR